MLMIVIRRLIWDSWNVAHIARHEVTSDEVEEVCHGEYIVRQTYDERLLLIGPALNGRMLVVILGPTKKRGVYYPVTARSASKKERNLYKTNIGEST
jgi:uncharacterized DUF497 family protein